MEKNKEHSDLIYIEEQDIYKLKHKTLNIWYPSIEVYELEKKTSEEIHNSVINKILWKR